jgi:hypothetical protein
VEPYPFAAVALKQIGDWIAQEEPPRTTFVEIVYYQDPFSCFIEATAGLMRKAKDSASYSLVSEVQLACEVTLVRSFATRTCHQISMLANLMKSSAVAAAELGGEFGYLLLLPSHNLYGAYQALMRISCESEAEQVVEMIAEVAANGFRPGLDSQMDPHPGNQCIDDLIVCDRAMVIAASREIFTRGHYLCIPQTARALFTRTMQKKLGDNLGLKGHAELDKDNAAKKLKPES